MSNEPGWFGRLFGRSAPTSRSRAAEPRTIPVTPPSQRRPTAASQRRPGSIYRADYLPAEEEREVFTFGPDGLPTGRLVWHDDRFVIEPDGQRHAMVNPASARLHTLGMYVFRLRGVGYHEAAVKSGDFRPGASVRLVREPENEHDPNAIAVYAESARRPAGYVNRQNAARITKALASGTDLVAISIRGDRAGADTIAPVILATTPAVLAHLMRDL